MSQPFSHNAACAAYTRLQLAEKRLSALEFAIADLRSTHYADNKQVTDAFGVISGRLYQQKADAYRDMCMWGIMLDPEDPQHQAIIDKAKDIAFEKYLDEVSGIMCYLRLDHAWGYGHSGDDEEKFRAEIERMEIQTREERKQRRITERAEKVMKGLQD